MEGVVLIAGNGYTGAVINGCSCSQSKKKKNKVRGNLGLNN